MTDKVQEAEKVWKQTNLAMDNAFWRGDAARFSKCRTENVKAVHTLLSAIKERDERIEAEHLDVLDRQRTVQDLKDKLRWRDAEVEQLRKVAEAAVSGALFDFVGRLTTLSEPLTCSEKHDATLVLVVLKEWAKERNLSLEDADVLGWNTTLASFSHKEGEE
jgi:hypothetical protein